MRQEILISVVEGRPERSAKRRNSKSEFWAQQQREGLKEEEGEEEEGGRKKKCLTYLQKEILKKEEEKGKMAIEMLAFMVEGRSEGRKREKGNGNRDFLSNCRRKI